MLFVQGGCDDEFADLDELQPVLVGLGTHAALHVVEGADDSFDLPLGSEKLKADTLAEAASVTAKGMRGQLQGRRIRTTRP